MEQVNNLIVNIPGLLSVILSPHENAVEKQLVDIMVPLKSVPIAWQKSDLDIASAKLVFSETIKKMPHSDEN